MKKIYKFILTFALVIIYPKISQSNETPLVLQNGVAKDMLPLMLECTYAYRALHLNYRDKGDKAKEEKFKRLYDRVVVTGGFITKKMYGDEHKFIAEFNSVSNDILKRHINSPDPEVSISKVVDLCDQSQPLQDELFAWIETLDAQDKRN
ncbi:MAG: hypothetical protein ACRBBR_04725 [Cellvibrionaceae bacterium]